MNQSQCLHGLMHAMCFAVPSQYSEDLRTSIVIGLFFCFQFLQSGFRQIITNSWIIGAITRKRKRSESCDSDQVELTTALLFGCHYVISSIHCSDSDSITSENQLQNRKLVLVMVVSITGNFTFARTGRLNHSVCKQGAPIWMIGYMQVLHDQVPAIFRM